MRTILVVDPHAPTLTLLAEALRLSGFRVLRAADPAAGLELYAQERPELVVVAADLPRIGELSLGKRIRESSGGGRIPLVAIDKGHLGKAFGVSAVLDSRADAYFADPTRNGFLEKVQELAAKTVSRLGAADPLSRSPVAAGSLDPPTLVRRLLELGAEKQSGVLVAESREIERRIFLREGMVVGFDSTLRMETPIRWLFGKGLLTPEQAGAALVAMTGDGLAPAAALVASGVVEAGEPLAAVMRGYTREGAARIMGMHQGAFRFHEGSEHLNVSGAPVTLSACVMEAARTVLPARSLLRALTPVLDRYPRPSRRQDLTPFGLLAREEQLARELDGSISLRDLLGRRGELGRTLTVSWALTMAGALEYAPTSVPRTTGEKPALQRRPPLPQAEVEALRDAALRAAAGSYFQVLGLGIAADTDDVERAYQELVTRFDAERLASHDLGDLQELVNSFQDRIDAAYRVLSSEERRKDYTEHILRRLEPTVRQAGMVPEAEVEVQRGVEMLGRDPRGAATAFERAIQMNPKEPAYYAYLAWARFRGAVIGSPQDRARDAKRVLRKGLAARPDDDRLIAILGILEAEAGAPGEARRHLSQALRINAENRLARAALRRLNRIPG